MKQIGRWARCLLRLSALVVAFTLWPVIASAHGDLPARIIDTQAGPYPLTIGLYNDPPRAGSSLDFIVDPIRGLSGEVTIAAMAVPATGTDATAVRAQTRPHLDVAGGTQGAVNLPVAGRWILQITVDGPTGQGIASVSVDAIAPAPIPVWLGWAIGLIPVYGFVAFILAQRWRRPRPEVVRRW